MRFCFSCTYVIQGTSHIRFDPLYVYVCVGEPFVCTWYYMFCMEDECAYILFFYVFHEVADEAIMLCGCRGDRWPIQ